MPAELYGDGVGGAEAEAYRLAREGYSDSELACGSGRAPRRNGGQAVQAVVRVPRDATRPHIGGSAGLFNSGEEFNDEDQALAYNPRARRPKSNGVKWPERRDTAP